MRKRKKKQWGTTPYRRRPYVHVIKFIVCFPPCRPIGALGWRVPQNESVCQDCQLRRPGPVQQQRHLSRHLVHGLWLSAFILFYSLLFQRFIHRFQSVKPQTAFVPVHLLRIGQRQRILRVNNTKSWCNIHVQLFWNAFAIIRPSNLCAYNPCQNEGVCIRIQQNKDDLFRCLCLPGKLLHNVIKKRRRKGEGKEKREEEEGRKRKFNKLHSAVVPSQRSRIAFLSFFISLSEESIL